MSDEPNLRIELRVSGHDHEVVYGVQAEAHRVKLSPAGKLEGEAHKIILTDSFQFSVRAGALNLPGA